MRYFVGDIVEIITSNYKSYEDMPSHEKQRFDLYNRMPEFIGQRFRVKIIYESYVATGLYPIGQMIKNEDVFLYRRPLINWLKYFISLFRK